MAEDISAKSIFLTFDDGPNGPYTEKVLDVLATFQAKATFFVCGQNIEKQPEVLQRIAANGHSIGIHSYSHSFWKVLNGELLEEISRTGQLIKFYTGLSTPLYRSPWGITRGGLKVELLRRGYRIYRWDIMAYDWFNPPAGFIARQVIKKARPNSVVLLHDGNKTLGGDRAGTADSLPIILEVLGKQGYKFFALPM